MHGDCEGGGTPEALGQGLVKPPQEKVLGGQGEQRWQGVPLPAAQQTGRQLLLRDKNIVRGGGGRGLHVQQHQATKGDVNQGEHVHRDYSEL
jgi:hypothetical protein